MTVRNAPSWLQNGSHSAEDDRLLLTALLGGSLNQTIPSGIIGAADLKVTQTGTASMNLNVASGAALINGTETTTQGVYNVVNDASLAVTISTANATNPRIDLVVAQVLDDQYSGASHLAQIVVVTGTAASSPVAPALPKNSYKLATIAVGAAVTSILTANITDNRANALASPSCRVFYSGTPALTPTTIQGPMPFTTKVWDTTGSYSTSTGLYTVPSAGIYSVKGQLNVATSTAGHSLVTLIYKNGVQDTIGSTGFPTTGVSIVGAVASDIACVAGDTLAIYYLASNADTLNGVANASWMSITRISFGP